MDCNAHEISIWEAFSRHSEWRSRYHVPTLNPPPTSMARLLTRHDAIDANSPELDGNINTFQSDTTSFAANCQPWPQSLTMCELSPTCELTPVL